MHFPDELEKETNNKIANYFCKRLIKSPDSSIAVDYLKERGLYDQDLLEKFKIGWCPEKQKPIRTLTVDLNGRLIFPIMDESGDVIAFSGRLPRSNVSKEEKKWLHESFAKEFCLYGIHAAIENIIKNNFVVIVEGQADVLSCHNYGFTNTVGLLGTNLSRHSQYFLRSLTKNFVLLMDSDKPGLDSAKKIEESLVAQNTLMNTSVGGDYGVINVNLSKFVKGVKCDPDSFLKKYKHSGAKKILAEIKERKK